MQDMPLHIHKGKSVSTCLHVDFSREEFRPAHFNSRLQEQTRTFYCQVKVPLALTYPISEVIRVLKSEAIRSGRCGSCCRYETKILLEPSFRQDL